MNSEADSISDSLQDAREGIESIKTDLAWLEGFCLGASLGTIIGIGIGLVVL